MLNVGAVATPVARTPDLIDSFYEATRPFWRFLGWVLSFTATDATAQVPPSKPPYDRALVASAPAVLNVGATATPVDHSPDLIDSFYSATRPFWRVVGWLMSFTAKDAWAQATKSEGYERVAVVTIPVLGGVAMTPLFVAGASAWRRFVDWLLRPDDVPAYQIVRVQ